MSHRLGLFLAAILGWLLLAANARAEDVERYALLVAVETQQGTSVGKLNGPVNDVKIMRDLLVDTYGFKDDRDHILVLNGKNSTVKAVREAFRKQLIDKAATHPGALTVFYFSGHGSVTTDRNGDEFDGIDETLVAYDSRAPGGRDIVDDEIDGWFDELRAHTNNAVFILDSCHSGTATRGDDKVARELPPNPAMGRDAPARIGGRDARPSLSKVLDFTTISGALANELSYEGADIPGARGVAHGYLTWSLVQALRLRPTLTWRQTLLEVQRRVGELAPAQHPQVEGNVDRVVFDGIGTAMPPHLDLVSQGPGSEIVVAAGEPAGIAPGSILAIYPPDARELVGPDGRLATAKVTRSGLTRSTALLLEPAPRPLPAGAKVTVLSVSTRAQPPRIKLDALADQATTEADRTLLGEVRAHPMIKELLGQKRLITAGGGDRSWLFAIQRACLAQGELQPVARGEPTPGCEAAYYIATRQSRLPLFSYFVRAEDPDRVARLADAIERLENQSDLRAQVNDSSRLKVGFQLVRIRTPPSTGGPGRAEPEAEGRMPSLTIGDKYSFQISNNSGQDMYVTVLALGTSGAVFPITASANGELLKPGVSVLMKDLITAGPPPGIETYKLLAATDPQVDFRRWLRGPLLSRDPAPTGTMTVDDWTTNQIDVQILAPGQAPLREGTR